MEPWYYVMSYQLHNFLMKKIAITLVFLGLLVAPLSARAQVEDLQLQINAIMAQIKVLQEQLDRSIAGATVQTPAGGAKSAGAYPPFCYNFTRNLRIYDQNEDVTNLYRAMIREGFMSTDEVFQDGRQVLTYDERLASAVTSFQEKYFNEILRPNHLARGNGYFGNSTRAKVNSLYGCKTQSKPFTATRPSPTLTVTSPSGGEVLKIGDVYTIQWQSNLGTKALEISIERILPFDTHYVDIGKINGGTYDYVQANSGAYAWTIPPSILWGGVSRSLSESGATYVVKVAEMGAKGTEIVARSRPFSIVNR